MEQADMCVGGMVKISLAAYTDEQMPIIRSAFMRSTHIE